VDLRLRAYFSDAEPTPLSMTSTQFSAQDPLTGTRTDVFGQFDLSSYGAFLMSPVTGLAFHTPRTSCCSTGADSRRR